MKRKFRWCAMTVALGFLSPVHGIASQAGDEWEYQGSMEMQGTKMPMPAVKRCEQPGGDDSPPMDKSCALKNRKSRGKTSTFDFHCDAPEAVDGRGTVVRADGNLEATYVMKMDDMEMTYVLSGKKLGGCTR